VKTLSLLLALVSVPALADILPEEVGVCRGKAAGTACTTPDGQAGTCAKMFVTRPDYSSGIPPTYRQVEMLGCVATAKVTARSMLPWLGAGLAFLALVAALAGRRGIREPQVA
jgi:hypothetical protein